LNQSRGALDDAEVYQKRLHANLTILATAADAQPVRPHIDTDAETDSTSSSSSSSTTSSSLPTTPSSAGAESSEILSPLLQLQSNAAALLPVLPPMSGVMTTSASSGEQTTGSTVPRRITEVGTSRPWTPLEQAAFAGALRRFGPNRLDQVAEAIGTRTVKQVQLFLDQVSAEMRQRRAQEQEQQRRALELKRQLQQQQQQQQQEEEEEAEQQQQEKDNDKTRPSSLIHSRSEDV
jgi:Sec-independent protein translocase protein TatA